MKTYKMHFQLRVNLDKEDLDKIANIFFPEIFIHYPVKGDFISHDFNIFVLIIRLSLHYFKFFAPHNFLLENMDLVGLLA